MYIAHSVAVVVTSEVVHPHARKVLPWAHFRAAMFAAYEENMRGCDWVYCFAHDLRRGVWEMTSQGIFLSTACVLPQDHCTTRTPSICPLAGQIIKDSLPQQECEETDAMVSTRYPLSPLILANSLSCPPAKVEWPH